MKQSGKGAQTHEDLGENSKQVLELIGRRGQALALQPPIRTDYISVGIGQEQYISTSVVSSQSTFYSYFDLQRGSAVTYGPSSQYIIYCHARVKGILK